MQHPSGWFVDFRDVQYEGRSRAFAGQCVHSIDGIGRDVLTWRRDLDSRPEMLPSGIESAVAILSEDGDNIIEDGGDDYLERWKRVNEIGLQ